ncbi:DUF7059 domain-containing protein [Brevibacterium daeguense]|uniref:DUF7059 domain-containing protein n=1 Tax=Brevibacterium daeguense TaxID=909936 RepID=UPI001F29D5EB
MTDTPQAPAPGADSLRALAEILVGSQYTPAGLRGLWGIDADAALQRSNAAPARWQIRRSRDPRAVLAGLFLLEVPQPRTRVDAVLGPVLVERLITAGLLSVAEATVTSRLALTPWAVPTGVPRGARPGDETLFLLADHGTLARPVPVPGDFVLGLGGAGRTLADITPRHAVGTAVDIGTGCGIQALLLARHADHVVATDVSERALRIAALNAHLNHAPNIEFRQGSLFEPTPEAFDLVVSNPPFVITPQGRTPALEYRDGGMTGDGVMRRLLEQTPAHLTADGHAAFLGNWEYGPGRTEPSSWSDAADTSVMVIERERLDPAAYSETWIRDGGVQRAGERFERDTAAWLSDFAARGVEEIGFGWVRMHRGEPEAGAGVRHFERLAGPLGANPVGTGAHLDTRLAMLEWLHTADDDELATTAFVRSGDVTEHRHHTPGSEAPTMLTIEQGIGFGQTFASDPALSGFLGVADGSLSLGAISGALASLLDIEEPALRTQLIGQVRSLVPAGVMYPAVSEPSEH